jgi:general stress protein 26
MPEAPMKTPQNAAGPVRQLADLVGDQRVAMLTARETDDRLQSRPMTPLSLDEAGNFWFFCDDASSLAATVRACPKVNLAFSDEGRATYVSVSGSAVIEHDRERIRDLWTSLARPWFPDGPDSAKLALLRVHCDIIELWNAADSTLIRIFALAASVVTGRPVGLGERDTLVPDSAALSAPAG